MVRITAMRRDRLSAHAFAHRRPARAGSRWRKAYNRSRSNRLRQTNAVGPRRRDPPIALSLHSRANVIVKFHLTTSTGNLVTGSGPGWVRVGTQEYRENLVLTPDGVVAGWAPSGFDNLDEAQMSELIASNPEVVILGTGSAIRFPRPALMRVLADAQVGLEVMDTAAACRTYNILAAEGRRVAAGLLIV